MIAAAFLRRTGRSAALLAALTVCSLTPWFPFSVCHAQQEHASTPGRLEGRPAHASPLQSRVDAAPAGATVTVEPGTYEGDLLLEKPVRLVGVGHPRLVGSGDGSVVRIRAADVTIEGFDIDGREGGDLGRDSSGVHVAAARATIRDCRIRDAIFGVYLREADGAVVEGCRIRGIAGKEPGEKGSGIHVWNTSGFRFERNEIVDVRDGFYIQSSSRGTIRGNVARDLRYGLHYMFSDDNVFEDNRFENGAAGTALMYSKRIVFRRNLFLHNRGFASVGLLFKACDDVIAEDNLIADNARGIFLEGSYRNVFRRNVVALSDAAIVLYDSSGQNRFEGNSFVSNLTPLNLVGRRTDTVFEGNYWSGNDEPDLDGDGLSDRPYRLTSVFDHFRGNLTAADLMSQGIAAGVLAAAEETFPVLRAVPVEDLRPLVRPPVLGSVPQADARRASANRAGLLAALAGLGFGTTVMLRGRR
jgi:nitrous oxidase accessory protein